MKHEFPKLKKGRGLSSAPGVSRNGGSIAGTELLSAASCVGSPDVLTPVELEAGTRGLVSLPWLSLAAMGVEAEVVLASCSTRLRFAEGSSTGAESSAGGHADELPASVFTFFKGLSSERGTSSLGSGAETCSSTSAAGAEGFGTVP